MPKQKPPNSVGQTTHFPYSSYWEEFAEPWEPLYAHGTERIAIQRMFASALEGKAKYLWLGRREVLDILRPLALSGQARRKLADDLYYLAGHHIGAQVKKVTGDTPADVRKKLSQISNYAAKVEALMGEMSDGVQRYMRGTRLALGLEKRGSGSATWEEARECLLQLATCAETIAAEMPHLKPGTSMNVLRGRWLRQSAAAVENRLGARIGVWKCIRGKQIYSFRGLEAEVFEAYCRRVDGGITQSPIRQAVKDFHNFGMAGPPLESASH